MEQPLFAPGDRVVCVDSSYSDSHIFIRPIVEGAEYTVNQVYQCKCSRVAVGFGQANPYNAGSCSCGAIIKSSTWLYDQTRFVPVDFDRYADEVLHESIKGSKVNQ